MGRIARPHAGLRRGECCGGLSQKEAWEHSLRSHRGRVNLFGPPNWLVAENRRGKEDVQITVQRLREELGIGPVRQLSLIERKKGEGGLDG